MTALPALFCIMEEMMDALLFPLWLSCTLLVGCAAWKLARASFGSDSLLSVLMHTLVLSWANLVLTAFLVGSTGILSGWTMMATAALLAAAMLGAARFLRPADPSLISSLPRTEAVWLWFWLAVLSVWIGHVVSSGLLQFPTDWDTLHYHLPLIVHWLQAGSLYAPNCAQWSFPGNNEIVGLWMVAPFSGDFLIALNNLPASVLLACAAVEVGRKLGLTPFFAHAAAFAVVSNYVVLNQLLDASNDVAAAGLFLACIAYGLRLAEDAAPNRWAVLALFAISLGLLAGVKFYALGYAALVATVFFFLVGKRHGWRSACRFAATALLGLTCCGGYWYFRNALLTGSPLYPKAFDPDDDVMAKIYPDIAHTSFWGNGQPELFPLAIKAVWQMSGPCHVAALVLLPLSFVWLTLSAWRQRPSQTADLRCAFAMLLAGAAGILLITPFAVEDSPGTLNQMHWHYCPVRYGLSFLSLAVLALAVLLQSLFASVPVDGMQEKPAAGSTPPSLQGCCRVRRILALLPPLFFLISGLYQIGFPDARLVLDRGDTVVIGGHLFLLAVNGLLIAHLWPRSSKALAAAMLLGLMAGGSWSADWLATRWHRHFASFYDDMLAPGTFSLLAEQPPQGQICVLDHRSYPFFGSRRQWLVCQPVFVPSASLLTHYCHDQDVRYIATRPQYRVPGWHLFDYFDECLRNDPDAFQATNPDNHLILYRLHRVIRLPSSRIQAET